MVAAAVGAFPSSVGRGWALAVALPAKAGFHPSDVLPGSQKQEVLREPSAEEALVVEQIEQAPAPSREIRMAAAGL